MKNKKSIVISLCLILLSVFYTILVKCVDVAFVNGSKVGFSSINKAVSNCLGFNSSLYKISEVLGYIALLVVLCYGLYGLFLLIKRKSLFKVDREILLLGLLFVVTLCVYIFFEKCIINYRPVLIDGVLEASYPSSHTVLALCVFGGVLIVNKSLFKDKKWFKYFNIFLVVMMISTVLFRFISGAHWFTDILGGLLISGTLLYMFYSLVNCGKTYEK